MPKQTYQKTTSKTTTKISFNKKSNSEGRYDVRCPTCGKYMKRGGGK